MSGAKSQPWQLFELDMALDDDLYTAIAAHGLTMRRVRWIQGRIIEGWDLAPSGQKRQRRIKDMNAQPGQEDALVELRERLSDYARLDDQMVELVSQKDQLRAVISELVEAVGPQRLPGFGRVEITAPAKVASEEGTARGYARGQPQDYQGALGQEMTRRRQCLFAAPCKQKAMVLKRRGDQTVYKDAFYPDYANAHLYLFLASGGEVKGAEAVELRRTFIARLNQSVSDNYTSDVVFALDADEAAIKLADGMTTV